MFYVFMGCGFIFKVKKVIPQSSTIPIHWVKKRLLISYPIVFNYSTCLHIIIPYHANGIWYGNVKKIGSTTYGFPSVLIFLLLIELLMTMYFVLLFLDISEITSKFRVLCILFCSNKYDEMYAIYI